MFTQLRFEFKTAPRRVYLALLIALIGLFTLSISQQLPVRIGNVTTQGVAFLLSPDKRHNQAMIVRQAQAEQKALRHELRSAVVASQARQFIDPLVTALKTGDYARANRLTLAHVTRHPELFGQVTYLSYFGFYSDSLLEPEFTRLLAYWLRVAPNRLQQVDTPSTALNMLNQALNQTDVRSRKAPDSLTYGILLIAVVAVVTAFFAADQRPPTMLTATSPIAPNTVALLRGLAVWLIINASLLLSVGLVVVALTASPAHDLGVWRFPILVPRAGAAEIVPLWRLLLRYLGLYNLWFTLIISGAHFIRQLTQDASVAMFCLALVPLAAYFHLLDRLPTGAARALPSFYVNLPALLNHQLQYAHTTAATVVLVFATWTCGLWLAATALAAAKRRWRVPLVSAQ